MKKRTNRPLILSLVALLIIATFICTPPTAYAGNYTASHMTFAFPQELNQYLRTDVDGILFFPSGSNPSYQLNKIDGETLKYNGKDYDVYSSVNELTPTSDAAMFRTYLKVGTNKTSKIKNSNPDYWPTSADNKIAVPDSIDDLKDGSQNTTFTWVKYTKITLDANGGTAGSKASFSIVKDEEMPALTSTGELPTKQGCTFNGFFDAATDGTKYYNADGTSAKKWDKTSASTTLYAQWTTNPTVTFDMQGHGTQVDAQTLNSGECASSPDAPSADGYTFGGWYTEPACTNEWNFSTPVTANTTLYAKWTALYCAFIDLNKNGIFDNVPETRYETLNAAFAAVNSQSGNDVTLMILSNIEEALTANYTFTKNVTITSSSPVTVDLKDSGNNKYLIPGNGTTLTIGENITLKNVFSIGADETSGSLVVDGTVTAAWIRAYGPKNSESKAHLVINGKVEGASTEAAIRVSQNSNVTINGSIGTQKDVTTVNASDFQIKKLYPAGNDSKSCDFKLNNAAINYTDGFDQSSVINYELNHSYIKVSGGTTPEFYLNDASTMNLKAASVLEVGDKLTIDSAAKLSISGNSTITAKDLTNNGTIVADMTGVTADVIKLIACSGTASYGEAGVGYKFATGKDNGYTLTKVDNDLFAKKSTIGTFAVNAAWSSKSQGETIKIGSNTYYYGLSAFSQLADAIAKVTTTTSTKILVYGNGNVGTKETENGEGTKIAVPGTYTVSGTEWATLGYLQLNPDKNSTGTRYVLNIGATGNGANLVVTKSQLRGYSDMNITDSHVDFANQKDAGAGYLFAFKDSTVNVKNSVVGYNTVQGNSSAITAGATSTTTNGNMSSYISGIFNADTSTIYSALDDGNTYSFAIYDRGLAYLKDSVLYSCNTLIGCDVGGRSDRASAGREGEIATLELDNSKLYANSGTQSGLTVGKDKAGKLVLKKGSIVDISAVDITVTANGTIELGGTSSITAKSISNNGTIIVDMTGATAARIKLIDCSGTGSYGTAGTNYKFVTGKDNGYTLTVDDNDLYAVCKAASIGGTKYATVQAAATAANSGETIKMIADSTETGAITISAGVTLDTNGNTLTNKGTITWNLTGGLESYGTMVKFQNYVNDGGTQRITVTADQPYGDYVIASGDFSNLTGKDTFTLAVIEQTTASISVGGSVFYCGRVYQLTKDDHGTPDDYTDDLLVLTVSDPDYLTFTADSAFNVALNKTGALPEVKLQYSTDKKSWSNFDLGNGASAVKNSDNKYVIYLRNGKTEGEYTTNTAFASSDSKYFTFSFTDSAGGAAPAIAASGNIMTLLDYTKPNAGMTSANSWAFFKLFINCTSLTSVPELPATTLADNCYQYMFKGCSALTTAPKLPATTLAKKCYYSMFSGCSSLTAAPALLATTLADECCYSMFFNCTSLTEAPALKAETLAEACYSQMFFGCSSLTEAPALPATTLAHACYYNMFNGCTALTAAPVLPATVLTNKCYKEMFKGCTSLLVKEGTAEDYTWKIPALGADDSVTDMATNTAAGSVTVAVPQSGTNYYKVIGLTGSDNKAVDNADAAAVAKSAMSDMATAIEAQKTAFNGTGTGAAGSESIKNELGNAGYVKVVLTGVGMDQTGAAAGSGSKVITYTFDVTPVHETSGAMHGNIGSNITFRLPVLSADATRYNSVILRHGTESLGTAPIEYQGTTAFVSVTSDKYSEFSYTLTNTSIGGTTTTTYAVSASEAKNGSVEISSKSASAGSTVTVTVKPDKGYTLETLTVLDKNGKEIELTAKKIGETYTFKMPSSAVTVKATFMEDNTMLNFFVDVKASDYFYDAVLWAATNGITSGTDNLHFAPSGSCDRAQVVTFLYRAFGAPDVTKASAFSDVSPEGYFADSVAWAAEKEITTGTGNGFEPFATVTRAQVVTFLWRAAGSPATKSLESFSDVPAGKYYSAAVAWAVENGITTGTGNGFEPNAACNRAQVVTFLYRYFVK